jgi:hypothetical protein
MVKCAVRVRQVSLKDISDANIEITRNVLENVYQNLRNQFDVGYNIDNTNASNSTASVVHNISSVSATAIKSRRIEKEHKKGRF